MTVASTTRRNDYDGNGTTAAYAYSFKIFAQSHLQVVVRNDSTLVETVLTLTTHYTVSGTGSASGGTVTLVAGSFAWLDGSNYLKTGYSMTIRRVPTLKQETDIRNQGSYFPETHEDQFDLFMHLLQYHEDELTRSVKLQTTSSLTGITIPDVQADKAIYGKADASGLEWRTVTATSGSYPGGFTAGLDAAKAASPSTNDVYIATDTKRVYVCFASGTWTPVEWKSGLDASKNASPAAGEVYFATDSGKIYLCQVAGTWVNKLVGIFNGIKGADIASATTIDLGASTGNFVDVTGTVTITGLGTANSGISRKVRFTGALLLTHNATSLLLPTAANITTVANDTAEFVSLGSGNWKCLWYQRYDGTPLAGAYTPTAANALSGSVVQTVNTQTGAAASGSTTIPDDDTIPQNTEGDQYMSLAITPTNASNKLRIDVVAQFAHSAGYNIAAAIFQDSTANALAAMYGPNVPNNNSDGMQIVFTHYMTAGTTSATTFKVRAGSCGGSATLYFNGNSTGRKFGGVMASSITITEIKA
jgi:hypothetical protein